MKLLNLIIICLASVVLVNSSRPAMVDIETDRIYKRKSLSISLAVLLLIVFAGLRTEYNDTYAYRRNFNSFPSLDAFIQSDEFGITQDAGFTLYSIIFKAIFNNSYLYIMLTTAFIIASFVNFIQNNVEFENMAFVLFLFIAYGYYTFTMGAMKQSLAMAMLTYALTALKQRKTIKYIILVFLASFIHFYAIIALIFLFLRAKPWSPRMISIILITIVGYFLFDTFIAGLLSTANSMGIYIAESELLNGEGMNIMRTAVYMVMPIMGFIKRNEIREQADNMTNLCINLSVVGAAFMLLALRNGANMFGRMAYYFYFIAILAFPKIINSFKSARILKIICICAFCAFFIYDNLEFESNYYALSITEFLSKLF